MALSGTNPDSEKTSQYVSVCDIWRDNVHKIITKVQFQTPLHLQTYVNMHNEFLHGLDTLFGTCYLWQKQYFDKLGFDQDTIDAYARYYDSMTDYAAAAMDSYAQLQKQQADVAISAMKAANNYARQWMDMCAGAVSAWGFQQRS